MKGKTLWVFPFLMFIYGCSSLSFIPTPPKMTIATTEYVDKAVVQQIYKSKELIMEETQKALSEMLEAERKRIDFLEQAIKDQKNMLEIASERMKEIVLANEQLKLADQKLEKDISSMADSLKVFQQRLEEMKAKNSEILKSIEKLKEDYSNISKQTLQELIDAINSYYEKK